MRRALIVAGLVLVALVAAVLIAGCDDNGGSYYDPGPVVVVHQHTTHVHVYVPPRPRVVVRPPAGRR